jgi:hypothetical protein
MMDFRRCGIFGSLYACARTCYLSASSLPFNVVLECDSDCDCDCNCNGTGDGIAMWTAKETYAKYRGNVIQLLTRRYLGTQ